ncbi:MAG: tetratricopeptide repeat protein [Spirochaetota bacterium]|nr:tetratricopeptide repeat protein [Spirochaetota bacterium]
MDVLNFSVTSITGSNHSYFKLDKSKDILKQDDLRKSLSHVRQAITKNSGSQNSSFETSAKVDLAETYIKTGKYQAAEQILKEISSKVFVPVSDIEINLKQRLNLSQNLTDKEKQTSIKDFKNDHNIFNQKNKDDLKNDLLIKVESQKDFKSLLIRDTNEKEKPFSPILDNLKKSLEKIRDTFSK